ncbi:MAG: hypothetical protein UT34_C0001G0243 [candidate division WS6 bacterium GW2011_GWF2_39_15]|uniref:Uncharacterized protein n=1 Tax=candidate division WS6 bacterium GW2011_GWF2_39_15 TaxID=1619100 RepID=A0A0G0MST8_9BACT|nr:MAG: hypothetical protein UT34_C0001G0243 [candidate division WS6 bacterium GW2011_GWF2_39_15]
MAAHRSQGKMELFDPRELRNSITPYQFIVNTIQDFLNWWYIKQPVAILKHYIRLIDIIDDRFSTSFLLRTFFVPWHRDNQPVGYLVGVIARLFFIPLGLTLIALTTTGYFSLLLFWIVIPWTALVMFLISPFLG